MICDECRNREVKIYLDYLYADAEKFKDDRGWWKDRFWWVDARLMRSLISADFQNLIYDELSNVSNKVNGFFEKTFYIHWSRVYWLKKFRTSFPNETRQQLVNRLFLKMHEDLSLPKGIQCHRTNSNIESYKYYTNGALFVRIAYLYTGELKNGNFHDGKVPISAEVVSDNMKLHIDNIYLTNIFTDCIGEWGETNEQVFNEILVQSGSVILDS
ncbi:MAG: hypothetical protein AB2806_00975 [Candidatus Thiodiazotropha sp.]